MAAWGETFAMRRSETCEGARRAPAHGCPNAGNKDRCCEFHPVMFGVAVATCYSMRGPITIFATRRPPYTILLFAVVTAFCGVVRSIVANKHKCPWYSLHPPCRFSKSQQYIAHLFRACRTCASSESEMSSQAAPPKPKLHSQRPVSRTHLPCREHSAYSVNRSREKVQRGGVTYSGYWVVAGR